MYWSRASVLVLSSLLLLGSAWAAPSALSATPSTKFYGDDGSWSAISIRVGSPQQWVDVLVSTGSSETWVVNPYGCDGTTTCATKRGGLFNWTQSSTWQSLGNTPYALGLDPQLGFAGAGDYGLDTLEFGTTGLSAADSIIGSINTTEYWVGFFGVGIVPGNFTTTTALSPISNLVEKAGLIPSHSYGFTAGASYQQKSEPCSLTLGGYDANRFVPHNVSFDLNPSQQPQAFLDSISVSIPSSSTGSLSSNPLPLLSHADGFSVQIDSSTPFLWLPKSVCEQFATALGLTYNTTLSLYTFDGNSSRHDDLRTWGLDFTFTLSNNGTATESINITLPYTAFDLQLTFPYPLGAPYGSDAANKYYFPLRQADNDTQFTIGRSFLQEAYMIVDYERNNFSVYQAVHISDPLGNTQLVDITSPGDSTFSSNPSPKSGLPKGAIVGIAVGAAAVIALAILLFWLFRRRRRTPPSKEEKDEAAPHPHTPISKSNFAMDGSGLRSPISVSTEAGSTIERHEMYAPLPDPSELDAGPSAVPRTPRDGTEKVKFSTYQQALFHEHVGRPVGAGSSSLALTEEPVPVSTPGSGATTPLPDEDSMARPKPLSAAAFLARMIERKNGGEEVTGEEPARTRGRRGEPKDKEKERENLVEEQVRYASARDSWAPGDDNQPRGPDEVQRESDIPEADGENQPSKTNERLARSESMTKSPKVLVMGRQSFMRGRRHAMPE